MAHGMAFVNGDFVSPEQATLSVFDLGFVRSDAVYDVTSVWRGQFFRLDDHLDRFLASCDGVRLPCAYSRQDIRRILANCVRRGGLDDAYVAMVATRGRFQNPVRRDITATNPTFIAYAIPYVWLLEPELRVRGVDVAIGTAARIPDASVEQRHKNYHWGDLTRGLLEAHDSGADTTVLCTTDGSLAEGPGFNLFFAKDNVLYTPASNVLQGITRLTVMALADEIGIAVEAGAYSASALLDADEAFICSTAGGIFPVRSVDGRSLSNHAPGPLSVKLRDMYWAKREAGWYGTPVDDILSE